MKGQAGLRREGLPAVACCANARVTALESTSSTFNIGDNAMEPMTDAANAKPGMLTGTFRDRDSAERAYSSLTSRGYTDKEVNLLMSDDTRKKHFSKDAVARTELETKALKGAGTGAAIGGTAGAAIAAFAAIGTSLLIPGLGIVVAGPLAAALAGAGAGGAAGGLIGALVGHGIPEDRAKVYESDIKNGGIVMGVTPKSADDASYFEKDWKSNRAENIYQ